MVNTEKLNGAIMDSGIKKAKIAEALSISRQSLSNKINNRTEFRAKEIKYLKDVLGLSPERFVEIFFAEVYDSESYRRA